LVGVVGNGVILNYFSMKILIEVEDNEVDFMLKLLSKFDFAKVEIYDELTEEETIFIKARLQHHLDNQDGAVSWDSLKKSLLK
jgi:hypothetical protein